MRRAAGKARRLTPRWSVVVFQVSRVKWHECLRHPHHCLGGWGDQHPHEIHENHLSPSTGLMSGVRRLVDNQSRFCGCESAFEHSCPRHRLVQAPVCTVDEFLAKMAPH